MPTPRSRRRPLLLSAALAPFVLATRQVRGEGADPAAGDVQIASEGAELPGYRALPVGAAPFPIVLVVSDGATGVGWAADSCRRLAEAGYLAVAPNLFAHGEPTDAQLLRGLDSAAIWAGQNGGDPARLAVTGFGAGGRVAWLYAAHNPALKAAVAWGGHASEPTFPDALAMDRRAPLLGLYAKEDRTNSEPALLRTETGANAAGHTVEIIVYVGAGPDFTAAAGSFTTKAAALDGWQRALSWLKRHGVA